MTTRILQSILVTGACLGFAIPQAEGNAPDALNSITVEFTGIKATYFDDLDPFTVSLTKDDLTTGSFRYEKTAENTGILRFTDWADEDETYTGTFTLTFTSSTTGTFYKDYTGTFTGYISGTFEILAMDVPGKPIAKAKTVRLKPNEKAKFSLKGKGLDIRESDLEYKIVQKPTIGKLNTKNLPVVIYQSAPGFTGTVKFTFIVKEGKTASKPATVKLVVK